MKNDSLHEDQIQWHPLALRFPLMEGDEWNAFRDSIKATGGNADDPMIFRMANGVKQGLDGRQRYEACRQLGLECSMKKVTLDDEEVSEFIIRRNVARRHLTKETRQILVAELRAEGRSTRQIAATLGVDQSTVVADLASGDGNPSADTTRTPTTNSGTSSQPNNPPPPKVLGKDGKSHPAKKPKHKTSQRAKSGRPVFDDRQITDLIRKFVWAIDARAKVYGKTPGFKDVEDRLEALTNAWKRWQLEKEKHV